MCWSWFLEKKEKKKKVENILVILLSSYYFFIAASDCAGTEWQLVHATSYWNIELLCCGASVKVLHSHALRLKIAHTKNSSTKESHHSHKTVNRYEFDVFLLIWTVTVIVIIITEKYFFHNALREKKRRRWMIIVITVNSDNVNDN